MNKTDPSDNKIQIDHLDIELSVVRDDHHDKNEYDSQTPNNNKTILKMGVMMNQKGSWYLEDLKINKIVDHEDQDILPKELNNSTNVHVTGLTSTGTSLQGLFLQYLYETVITILCLRDLYKGIFTVMYPVLSL